MASLLAFDLGTRTGWALARPARAGFLVTSGYWQFDPAGHEGARFISFRSRLHEIKETCDRGDVPISRIAYERVDFMMPGQVYAAHVWGALWGTLTAWACHHAIPVVGYPPATLKRHATGKGNAKKPEMVAAMRARFPELDHALHDHNEADALAALDLDLKNALAEAA